MVSAISNDISLLAYCCGGRLGYLGLLQKKIANKIPGNYDFWVDSIKSRLD